MACVGIGGGAVYTSGGRKWSGQSGTEIAASRPLMAPVGGDKASTPPPRRPSKDLAPALPTKPLAGAGVSLAPNATKATTAKSDAVVAVAPPSRLALYRERVSEAARAQPGNPSAYLAGIGQSRLTAVRSGICESGNIADVSLDYLKDASVCGRVGDGAKTILVIGDSVASDAYAWLHAAYPEYSIIQKTGPGCNLTRVDSDNPKTCAETLKTGFEMAQSPTQRIDAVVLATLWPPSLTSPNQFNHSYTEALIDKVLAAGRKVVLVGPPVGFTVSPSDLVDKCPSSAKDGLLPEELDQCVREHSNVYRVTNTAVKEYARQKGLSYVDIHELACNDAECPIFDEQGQLMFIDVFHRSFPGDADLARRVRQSHLFERIFGAH
jgi:hypothetical protein